MPVYDSRGRTTDNYEYSGPARSVAWADSAPMDPLQEEEKRLRNELMQEQLRGMQQSRVSKWEAERAADVHPYEHMPMERMALDQGSPLYQWEKSAPDAGIQMEMEPQAGAWAAGAPDRMPMTDMGQRVPQDPQALDMAFSKTNLNRWNDTQLSDTPEARGQRALLEYYGRIASDATALPEQKSQAQAEAQKIASGMAPPQGTAASPIAGAVGMPPPQTGAPASGSTSWWSNVSEEDKVRYKDASVKGDKAVMAEIRSKYGAP